MRNRFCVNKNLISSTPHHIYKTFCSFERTLYPIIFFLPRSTGKVVSLPRGSRWIVLVQQTRHDLHGYLCRTAGYSIVVHNSPRRRENIMLFGRPIRKSLWWARVSLHCIFQTDLVARTRQRITSKGDETRVDRCKSVKDNLIRQPTSSRELESL